MCAEMLLNAIPPNRNLFNSPFLPSFKGCPHSIITVDSRRTNTSNPLPLQRNLIIRQEINNPIPIRAPQQRPERIGVLIRVRRGPRKRFGNILPGKTLIEDGLSGLPHFGGLRVICNNILCRCRSRGWRGEA